MKALVARALAGRVKDGEIIGLGSGSTVEMAVDQIGQRIAREGIRVVGVPTSLRTAMRANQAGIKVLSPHTDIPISWAFDGADEVDRDFNMIKGRGGAMLSEKIMARRAQKLVIIVSEDKLVDSLGKRHPVPIEVIAEAQYVVRDALSRLGARECEMRAAANKYGPVITEHGNIILDAWFDEITPELDDALQRITGVVETGLFVNFGQELLVAGRDKVWSRQQRDGALEEKLLEG